MRLYCTRCQVHFNFQVKPTCVPLAVVFPVIDGRSAQKLDVEGQGRGLG